MKDFLIRAEEIAAEEPSYRVGGIGQDGTCDCIGLVVGAIRRAGGKWTGRKGTNYAARVETENLSRITGSADLAVGEAVFKARAPGEKGYDAELMSSRYASSPDRNDYYHIGVVESVHPLRIRHMTTPRVKMDTSLGNWSHHGWLKLIEKPESGSTPVPEVLPASSPEPGSGPADMMKEGEPMIENATASGGNPLRGVNLRIGASRASRIIAEIPQDSRISLLEWGPDWCRVRYPPHTGYMMTRYVHRESEASDPDPVSGAPDSSLVSGADEWISVPRRTLEQIYDSLGDLLGLRG